MAFIQFYCIHRAKSMSTPTLAGANKQSRGQCSQPVDQSPPSRACPSAPSPVDPGEERKRWGPSVSRVEQERQQILEEMKKRTQLLTDNSWIRQRSSSVHKEPVYVRLRRRARLFSSYIHLFFYSQPFIVQLAPLLLQVWVSGQPRRLSTAVRCTERPPAPLRRHWLLQPQEEAFTLQHRLRLPADARTCSPRQVPVQVRGRNLYSS